MEPDTWRSVALRGITYASEHLIRLALTAIVGIFVARHLGPDGLGLLSYAQSVFGLLLPIVLLGLPAILVREFSAGADWRVLLASALSAQAPVAVIVAGVGFILIAVSRGFETQAVLTALAMVPVPLLTMDRSIRSYLEASGRSRTILLSGVAASVTASTVKVIAVVGDAEVWVFALAGTLEVAITAGGLLLGIPGRARFSALRRRARVTVARDLARESWPLMLSALAVTVYMRVDIVMLGLMAGDQETGIYTAAARLSELWYFLPMAAVAALRPRLSALHAEGAEHEYTVILQRFMTSATGASYIAVGIVLLVGPQIVDLLYGFQYAPAATVLQIHILAAPFVFLGVAAGPWFVDRRMGQAVLARSSIGAAVNLALNLLLIPVMGARGAAIATLVSYMLSGFLLNGLSSGSRPLLFIQLRSLTLRWSQPDHSNH